MKIIVRKIPFLLLWLFILPSFFFTSNAKAQLIIDDATDVFTTGIGTFAKLSGNDVSSSPGQVYEVLGGPTNDLHNTPSESATRSSSMGDLWDFLNGLGAANANILIFGFGIDETGAPGSNSVYIDSLTMSFEKPDNSVVSFALGTEVIEVFNFAQGANTAEAMIQVNLPFNFMTLYNTNSIERFTISSSIRGTDDGPEIYFLNSGFYQDDGNGGGGGSAVPEPATMALMGFGLMGIALAARKRNK